VTFENAAALPTALLTEHGALRAGNFAAGQTVLITGATSAIGLVGLQIARELGARTVLATTRSSTKADLLRQCGADIVLDTAASDLPEAVLDATDGDGVDLVLDHVGGPLFARTLPATGTHGTIVQVGRLDPTPPTINLDHIAYRRLTVRGVSFGAPDELAELLDQAGRVLLPAVAAGRIKPVIDRVLRLDEAVEAARRVRDGLAVGKVVLRMP
jgi:NADPH:quinone reductase-like Zn-dependent oxidoreductase